LRDGYRAFEADVLARGRESSEGDRVIVARDPRELSAALFGPNGRPDAVRQLHDLFIEVMSHQLAVLNGVMEGVKTLLGNLSPKAIEEDLDRKGKKTGLFGSKYEDLWRLYQERHADYSGEDKQIFLTVFGRQFYDAYTASVDEDYKASGDARKIGRFPPAAPPKR
jgi:type VI secretion system protein ImpI